MTYCTESKIFLKGCGGLTVSFPPFQCMLESLRFTLLKKVFGVPRSPGLVASGASWRVTNPFPWTGWKKCTHPSPLPFLWLRAPGCICGTFPRPGLSGGHEGSPYGHRSVSSVCCPAILSCQMPAVIGPPLEPARQSEQSCGNSCSTKLPGLDPFRLRLETFGNKIPCGMMGAQTHQPLGAL